MKCPKCQGHFLVMLMVKSYASGEERQVWIHMEGVKYCDIISIETKLV